MCVCYLLTENFPKTDTLREVNSLNPQAQVAGGGQGETLTHRDTKKKKAFGDQH